MSDVATPSTSTTRSHTMHPDLAHDPEQDLTRPCPCGCQGTSRDGTPGWHATAGPLPVLRARHDLPRSSAPRWLDHCYRLRLGDGRWRYVTEPYELSADALADLTYLASAGFEVTVTAWQASHLPGHTVAVSIEQEASS